MIISLYYTLAIVKYNRIVIVTFTHEFHLVAAVLSAQSSGRAPFVHEYLAYMTLHFKSGSGLPHDVLRLN